MYVALSNNIPYLGRLETKNRDWSWLLMWLRRSHVQAPGLSFSQVIIPLYSTYIKVWSQWTCTNCQTMCLLCISTCNPGRRSKYRLGRVFVYSTSVCVCTCRVDEVLVTEVESLIALQCVGWSWSRCAILPKRTIGGRTEGPLHTTSVSSLCHMHLIHTLLHTMSDIYTYTALINTSSSVSTSAAFLSQPILITWDNVLFVFIVCRQDHTVTKIVWNFIDWLSPLQKMECVVQPMSADHLTMRFRLLSVPHLCQQAN